MKREIVAELRNELHVLKLEFENYKFKIEEELENIVERLEQLENG